MRYAPYRGIKRVSMWMDTTQIYCHESEKTGNVEVEKSIFLTEKI